MLEGLWTLFIFFSGFLISASRGYQNPSQTSVDMPLIQNRWEEEFLKEVSMEKTADHGSFLHRTRDEGKTGLQTATIIRF